MNKKIIEAPYEGILKLGNNELNCYVLSDGTRLISQSAVFKAFGRERRGRRRISEGGIKVPSFIDAKNLEPFIDSQLSDVINPIMFKNKQGKLIYGYRAEIIPLVCDLYLKAREAGNVLTSQQLTVARSAEILVRSLAKVGIIALVDEATGYQYERENNALQAILKLLISDEILEYQKQFQISFYKEIFRLWNIPFTDQNIKRKPQFIGHLTNKFVYQNMPAGTIVLEKLKDKTPKTISGNYKFRFHQSLTKEAGIEALKKVLYSIEAIASISRDKNHFKRLVEEKYGQKQIPFTDLEEAIRKDETNELSNFNKKLKKAIEYNLKVK
jgi:hypothetical protein